MYIEPIQDENVIDHVGNKTTPSLQSPLGDVQLQTFVQYKTLKVQGPKPTCGKILAYCKSEVNSFRHYIGFQVCVFKVGVTAKPEERFLDYMAVNFTSMWVIHQDNELGLIHMLEAALVDEFHSCVGCRNAANSGGEGGLNKKNHCGPPFYCYITGGRADQLKKVG